MPTNTVEPEIKLIECPRDAMQGILDFIPTSEKIAYLNKLLRVGFHTLDCGSFVSPKAIPQMRDTQEVLDNIDLDEKQTKLSVIVANLRGANDAAACEQVDYLGFPFSVSENFQKRNTRKSIAESLDSVKEIYDICLAKNKDIVIYISMCFGNPYKEEWNAEIVSRWVDQIHNLGIKHFSLSDTVGVSNPKSIEQVFSVMQLEFPKAEFGAHFHTTSDKWEEKVKTAHNFGCKRFDGALKGYGGCPMAKDDLVGNMPTEKMVQYFGYDTVQIEKAPFKEALILANQIFSKYQ